MSAPFSPSLGRSLAPSRGFRRGLAAALFALLSIVGTAAARAGEAVRLLVELPPDVQYLDCGETLDVQVVGEDAQRGRTGFSRRTVQVSVTHGTIALVRRPYRFRYTTPATLPATTDVKIRAWLKEAPEISGEVVIPVGPPAPFERIVFQGPGSVAGGTSTEILLRGETADRRQEDVPEATVTVTAEGPASVELVRTSVYRLRAAADRPGTVKVTAALVRFPHIRTTIDVLVTAATPAPPAPVPAPPAPATPTPAAPAPATPAPSPAAPTPTPETPAPATPAPAAPSAGADGTGAAEDAPPAEKQGADEGVAWTSGRVTLETWRVRDGDKAAWIKDERKLPAKGTPFVANHDNHRIRAAVAASNVAKIEVEEWTGPKGSPATPLEPTKDGRFQLVTRKDGTRVVHYEVRLPAGNRPASMAIVVTLADGTVTRDEFTFRRGEPSKK